MAAAWVGLLVLIAVSAQMGDSVFIKKYYQDLYFGGNRLPMHTMRPNVYGLNYLKSNNLTRQMDENERIMSFNHFIDQGCPVLNQCYQNYFEDIGLNGDSSSREELDIEMCRVANHNLYGCFQSAFENADLCSCATSQVEEAVQYIHGFETDYSRHMNMHCQGYHDFFEQNQECHPRMMECASKLEYLMYNDLRYKCARREDIEDLKHCFREMHAGRKEMNMERCPYLRWFQHMSQDHNVEQLFRLFESEIQGCPVNEIMYSCGHNYDRMGPSVMCSMRNHYMKEYTQCMTRMMEATPDCHQMRSLYQANSELMRMFSENQCQMSQDVHYLMSRCCNDHLERMAENQATETGTGTDINAAETT